MAEAVDAGWDALARGAWDEALALLEGLDDDPDALEAVGVAQWWLDDADATIGARERAYRLYRDRDDHLGAARVAGALAWDSVLFGGRTAIASGWIDRGARLLEDEELAPEHAWLAVREAEVALARSEPATAREAARRAISIGQQLDREEVQVVGRSLEGVSLVHEGRIDEGMRRLDESAVAATAGDLKDMMWIGKVCCNLIAACERVGDDERATQWCEEVKEFARRSELRTLFNVCRTQYAAVLIRKGAWSEAESELEAAIAVFSGGQRAALVEGTARLGELRRRQGRLDEARSLFAQSERSWIARIGNAELALDEGDAPTALAHAERLERATEGSHLDRIQVLSLLARAAAAAGRPATAAHASLELNALAADVGTTGARATAAHAGGVSAFAAGDLELAQRRLEDAVDLFDLCNAPYERARARLVLARVLFELGPEDRGQAEAIAARDLFLELDAQRDLSTATQLLGGPAVTVNGNSPLTPREHEVLALVAAGRSNREIASELVVSQHTVHRHVANILRKLREPTRAAAAARAIKDGLV
jgi:ATP/maltotriose-dependent transcriptional regulator MalT